MCSLSSNACSAVTHCQCFFLLQTSFTSRTSAENPLHDVGFVIWCIMFALPSALAARHRSTKERCLRIITLHLCSFLSPFNICLASTRVISQSLAHAPLLCSPSSPLLLLQLHSTRTKLETGWFTDLFFHETKELLQIPVNLFFCASSTRDHELVSRETWDTVLFFPSEEHFTHECLDQTTAFDLCITLVSFISFCDCFSRHLHSGPILIGYLHLQLSVISVDHALSSRLWRSRILLKRFHTCGATHH